MEAQLHDSGGTRWWWAGATASVAAFVGLGGAYAAQARIEEPEPVVVTMAAAERATVGADLVMDTAPARDLGPYEGYGAWVDVFDYDPAYAGARPSITAADLAEMARLGVDTLYLQAARLDDRTPQGLVDGWRLAELVLAAKNEGLDVVAWYLPLFDDVDDDLERVTAIHEFEVLGHRFDGIALDIEWIGGDIDDDTRSDRLVELGARLRGRLDGEPLAAITQPPVLMEVVNPDFWPGFPWQRMADHYDVWMPMSYWSWRSAPYDDGYAYHEESVRRLRANVGDPDALVHGIGGIGGVDGIDDPVDPPEPLASIGEVRRFLEALDDTGSIGGSLYDWDTTEPAVRELLRAHFDR